jgi:hypothetical protein
VGFHSRESQTNGALSPESGPLMPIAKRRYNIDYLFADEYLAEQEAIREIERNDTENPWKRFSGWKRGQHISRIRWYFSAQQENLHYSSTILNGQPVCSCSLIASKPLIEDDAFEVRLYLYEPGHLNQNRELTTLFLVELRGEHFLENWFFCQFCGLLEKAQGNKNPGYAEQYSLVESQHQDCDMAEYLARLGISKDQLNDLNFQAATAINTALEKKASKPTMRMAATNKHSIRI